MSTSNNNLLKEMDWPLGIKIFDIVYKDKKGAYVYRKYGTVLPICQGTGYNSEMGRNAIKDGGILYCLGGVECIVNNVLGWS